MSASDKDTDKSNIVNTKFLFFTSQLLWNWNPETAYICFVRREREKREESREMELVDEREEIVV